MQALVLYGAALDPANGLGEMIVVFENQLYPKEMGWAVYVNDRPKLKTP